MNIENRKVTIHLSTVANTDGTLDYGQKPEDRQANPHGIEVFTTRLSNGHPVAQVLLENGFPASAVVFCLDGAPITYGKRTHLKGGFVEYELHRPIEKKPWVKWEDAEQTIPAEVEKVIDTEVPKRDEERKRIIPAQMAKTHKAREKVLDQQDTTVPSITNQDRKNAEVWSKPALVSEFATTYDEVKQKTTFKVTVANMRPRYANQNTNLETWAISLSHKGADIPLKATTLRALNGGQETTVRFVINGDYRGKTLSLWVYGASPKDITI